MDIQHYAKQIAFQLRKQGYTYDQTRHLFQLARQEAGLTAPKQKKNVVRPLSDEQVMKFLDTAVRKNTKTGMMMRILFESALRVSEFCALECGDFDHASQALFVAHGKGDKARRVVISRHSADLLHLYLNGRTTGPIFPSRYHKAYSARAIQMLVKDIARQAGLEFRIHPHLLRHTRATLLCEKGMTTQQLKGMLGHESEKTTEVYTRTAQHDLRGKINELHPYDVLE